MSDESSELLDLTVNSDNELEFDTRSLVDQSESCPSAPERPLTPLPPPILDSAKFECAHCPRAFTSKYALERHLTTHVTCNKCHVNFSTSRELVNHEPFCARRFGIIRVDRGDSTSRRPRGQKVKKLPFHCQLCKRRYETKANLRNHQIFRCRKRYITPAWCVKI